MRFIKYYLRLASCFCLLPLGYHCSFFLDPLQSLSSKRNSRCPLYLFPPLLPLVPSSPSAPVRATISLLRSPHRRVLGPRLSPSAPCGLAPWSSCHFHLLAWSAFKSLFFKVLKYLPGMCVVLLTQRSSSCLTLPSQVPPTEQPSQCSAHCFSVCSKARAAEWKRARANWPEFDPPRSIPPIIRPTHQSGPIMN